MRTEGLCEKNRVAQSVVSQTVFHLFLMCLGNLHEVLQAAIVRSPLLAERSGQRLVLEMLEGWKFFLNYRMGFSNCLWK